MASGHDVQDLQHPLHAPSQEWNIANRFIVRFGGVETEKTRFADHFAFLAIVLYPHIVACDAPVNAAQQGGFGEDQGFRLCQKVSDLFGQEQWLSTSVQDISLIITQEAKV